MDLDQTLCDVRESGLQASSNEPLLETNDRSALKCALMCAVHHAHTGELCKMSCSQRYRETFTRSMVKLLQLFTKGGAKHTGVLKKLCVVNGISFVKLGTFHNFRCY